MLIQINLHPERGRRRRAPRSLSVGAAFGGRLSALRDKYLLGAVAAVVVACGLVGGLYTTQRRERDELTAQEETAVRDSTRYASALAARNKATMRRDSLARELRAIAAIDSNRYVWAHLLDEVSRTLPVYTWLTSVQQTSAPAAPPLVLGKAEPKAAKSEGGAADTKKVSADTLAGGAVRFRLVGQTVDLQALTRFMRDLEFSPFVRNVQLAHSEPVSGGNASGAGRDVTEFTLDAEFEHAPRGALRTTSITVPVR